MHVFVCGILLITKIVIILHTTNYLNWNKTKNSIMWEKLYALWLAVDKIPTTLKNTIIFIGVCLFLYIGGNYIAKNTIAEAFSKMKTDKKKSETYTVEIAPKINYIVNAILDSDTNISNVLLMNYHNSTESVNGLSYLYMTTLAEAYEEKSIRNEWRELLYIDYAIEMDKLHRKTMVNVNSLEMNSYPLLSKRLNYCDVKYSTWFGLTGKSSNIGVLVIIYKNAPPLEMSYYSRCILESRLMLIRLLDYENKDMY